MKVLAVAVVVLAKVVVMMMVVVRVVVAHLIYEQSRTRVSRAAGSHVAHADALLMLHKVNKSAEETAGDV